MRKALSLTLSIKKNDISWDFKQNIIFDNFVNNKNFKIIFIGVFNIPYWKIKNVCENCFNESALFCYWCIDVVFFACFYYFSRSFSYLKQHVCYFFHACSYYFLRWMTLDFDEKIPLCIVSSHSRANFSSLTYTFVFLFLLE